ncbi:MAG: NmrA family NAD(P)-binding protein, partial [Aeromicrobium sp.]
MTSPKKKCLVTGATGYVGGRLVTVLLEKGFDVRVMVRDERKARAHAWSDRVEIAVADATERSQVADALDGID